MGPPRLPADFPPHYQLHRQGARQGGTGEAGSPGKDTCLPLCVRFVAHLRCAYLVQVIDFLHVQDSAFMPDKGAGHKRNLVQFISVLTIHAMALLLPSYPLLSNLPVTSKELIFNVLELL